ncbi:Epstein-Barr virus EBNA-1-like [Oryza sativa Japonica Group]|uniref:Epstein-Barr virus EBNA-1-like n=1 Tax=Oryza sativa subsp. japonica TaxID=39947 RepID=Q5ZE74_ORYSJ|nr:Epstein-Barr virus EBNA-1-like [Oryza sativa Japonica Group]
MTRGVHFTHTTLLTWITQPVGISHVGRPPSFHDKAFSKADTGLPYADERGPRPTTGSPDKLVTQPGVSHSTHVVVLVLCSDEIPRKRSLSARAGNRTPASRLAVDRARERGRRERLTGVGSTRSWPSWRLRGSNAGRREVEEDAGRNGRRTAVASGGAKHGDLGEREHTGKLRGTRGVEPTARIRWRELDGGGLRRRPPAERKGENGDEVTRGRFPAARASTRLRESVPCAGLGGNASRKAGDERRFRARAATAASTRRATAKVGAALASYEEATRATTRV